MPLKGAPPVKRVKTYSAQTGYVYRYCYEGHRPFGSGNAAGTEHIFRLTAKPGAWLPGRVLVSDAAVDAWQRAHGRELSPTERYALAKMALFQAFDERAPGDMKHEVRVREADVEGIAAALGLD